MPATSSNVNNLQLEPVDPAVLEISNHGLSTGQSVTFDPEWVPPAPREDQKDAATGKALPSFVPDTYQPQLEIVKGGIDVANTTIKENQKLYVIRLDENRFELAETFQDALDEKPITIKPAQHSDLATSMADPASAHVTTIGKFKGSGGTLNMSKPHGLESGQRVKYTPSATGDDGKLTRSVTVLRQKKQTITNIARPGGSRSRRSASRRCSALARWEQCGNHLVGRA